MVEDRPVVAFTLSLIGLALHAIGTTFLSYPLLYGWSGGPWGPGMMGPWMMMGGTMPMGGGWSPFTSAFPIVALALGMIGVLSMNTADVSRVRTGSALVLAASIIAFQTFFGFLFGSLLMLIGGIIGLAWQPTAAKEGERA